MAENNPSDVQPWPELWRCNRRRGKHYCGAKRLKGRNACATCNGRGGAPDGNANARTHGAYQDLRPLLTGLTPEARAAVDQMDVGVRQLRDIAALREMRLGQFLAREAEMKPAEFAAGLEAWLAQLRRDGLSYEQARALVARAGLDDTARKLAEEQHTGLRNMLEQLTAPPSPPVPAEPDPST